MSFGHGRPGPILLFVRTGTMEDYFTKATDEQKLQLYKTDDMDATRRAIDTIDTLLAKLDEGPSPTTNVATIQTNSQ